MRVEVLYLGAGERKVVGELAESVDGKIFFEYHPDWMKRGIELSPIYLPSNQKGSHATPTPAFGPLYGLFADSLPDWWGEQMMKYYFAKKGVSWNEVSILQKLACTGRHAMGAMGYQTPSSVVSFRDELTVEVAQLVTNAHSFIHGETKEMLPGLLRSGLSPGGAQPKVLLGFNDDFTKSMAGGGRLPAGYSRWLLKFDLDPEYELGKEEYAYSLMARAAGIRMAHTHLLPGENGAYHFLSKRFDRPGDTRRHVHTYSGVTHVAVRDGMEYDELMDLTRVMTGSESEVEEIFRRACFNVLAGNDDDHAKNHAFIMELDGSWMVAPAYDLTHTSNPLVSGMRAGSIFGKNVAVGREDLQKLGEAHGVRRINETIEQVIEAVKDWPIFAKEAGMNKYRMNQVADEMQGKGI